MSEFIEIHFTCGTIDEGRKIARYLVQERHVACAQIIPWIESVYMWDNKLNTAQESKVVFKTRLDKYETVRRVIKENCKYELPEITWRAIDGGNQEYLDWLKESTPDFAAVK